MSLKRLGLASLAGLLVSVALLVSPLLGQLPPLFVPYVPIDLRFVILPATFALLQLGSEHLAWPTPATSILGTSVLAAIAANLHASEVLAYLGVAWARGGAQVDLATFAPSLAAVLVALWIAFDAAHDRFCASLVDRGVDEALLDPVTRVARGRAREAVAVAGLAAAGLGLVLGLAGTVLAGRSLPFPELVAIGMVLAAGALLLGLPRREQEPS